MLIVLEGPDGAGKTTKAQNLRNQVTMPSRVRHSAPPGPYEDLMKTYELHLSELYDPMVDALTIYDRLHVGEQVYGPLLRGKSKISDAQRTHLDLFLQSRGAAMFYLTARPSTLLARITARDDGNDLAGTTSLASLTQIVKAYDSLIGGRPWLEVNTDHVNDQTSLTNLILAHARKGIAFARTVHDFAPTYVGPASPKIVFVGDVHRPIIASKHNGQATVRRLKYPSCFVPYPNNVGEHLLDSIATTGLKTNEFGLLTIGDTPKPRLFWDVLGSPTFVALGHMAHIMLSTEGIPHKIAPSPEEIGRFIRSHDYGRMITR